MAFLDFPWDDIGAASGLVITERCHTVRTNYGAGYVATRAETTKIQKRFELTWKLMRAEKWLALVEFWRSVYGSADAFNWKFPFELYGVAGYGGELGEEPFGGWDMEGDGMGFGAAPVFLVRFAKDIMVQNHKKPFYWGVKIVLEEVA